METKVKENHDKATIVNGVVLTEDAINQLRDFQEEENHVLKISIADIHETIKILAVNIDEIDSRIDLTDHIRNLAYLIDKLRLLMKP